MNEFKKWFQKLKCLLSFHSFRWEIGKDHTGVSTERFYKTCKYCRKQII